MSCLSENTVVELAEGLLAKSEAERVEQHIAGCASCRRLVSELAKQLSLLQSLGSDASITDDAPASADASAVLPRARAAEELARGDFLGRYVILETLGKGGMGIVFSAYDPELDRKVALKILRREILERAPGAELRLMREAQAMARISHPNVLAVHDVGTLDKGLFFAMEHVDGSTLARWLTQEPRTWREILDVFIEAAHGLSAAHAAGLVHRDFKPENVLISKDGRVRVADFGLARALDVAPAAPAAPGVSTGEEPKRRKREPSRMKTRSGAVLGTPAYMAPEQFEGVAVDALADQFSFCVALYEALVGERPFSVSTRETILAEAPGGKLRRPKDPPNVPAYVLRALERGLLPTAEQRFPSMAALIAALTTDPRRVFRGRVLGAIAVVALGLAAFGAVRAAEPSAPVCRGAEEKFASAWGEAQRQAIRERFVATGLPYAEDAFHSIEKTLDAYGQRWSTMHTEACEATRLRGEQSDEVLSLRMLCLDRRLEEARALVSVLGTSEKAGVAKAPEAAESLGDLSLCADVEGLRAPVRLPERQAAAAEAKEIGEQIARAAAMYGAGRYQDGLGVASAAVTRAEALQHAPTEAEALVSLSDLQRATGDAKASEASLRRAFSAAQAGHHDRAAALAAIELVDVVGAKLHRADEGLQWAWLAEAALRRVGREDRLLALLYENRGNLHLSQTDYARAGEQYEESLALWTRAAGPPHLRVAFLLFNLAQVASGKGETAKGMELVTRAYELLEAAFRPNHPKVAAALVGVGDAHQNQGQYAEALPLYRKALAVQRAALGSDNVKVGQTLLSTGHLLAALHQSEDALAAYREALSIFEKDKSMRALAGETLQGMAIVHADAGRLEEGLATNEKALAAFEDAFGPESDQGGATLLSIGDILFEQGKHKEAGERYARAIEIWEKVDGPDDFQIGVALTGLGKIERAARRTAQAVAFFERAVKQLEKYDGNPVFLAIARFELALALWDGGVAKDRAKQLAKQAEEALAGLGKAEEKELGRVRAWLAGLAGH